MDVLKQLNLTELQESQFETYFNFLVEYNEKVNLTAITEKEDVYIKHFFDSCLAKDLIKQNARVVDVGTGAGFPAIPLKIVRPDINLTLVDSLNKRIVFLNELAEKLNINYTTIHSRAEDFAHGENREKFDIVVARAVASMDSLAEYLLPLTKVGGKVIAYKGSNYKEEIEKAKKAIKILGGEIEQLLEFELPNNSGSRALVVIKKASTTPKQYPRGKNLPKVKPIS